MTEKGELSRLADMLFQATIPYEIGCLDWPGTLEKTELFYPSCYYPACLIVENIGGKSTLCIQGLLTDEEREEDEYSKDLNAEDVFKRIKAHWEVVHNHEIDAGENS